MYSTSTRAGGSPMVAAVLAGTLITHLVQAKAQPRAPRGSAVDVAQVDAQPATPRPDEFGGIASTHIVLRLRLETYERVRVVTPGGFGDPDPRSRSSKRFQTAAHNWHVTKMRPLYGEPFADPVLAARYGLDRTYVLEVPHGTDTETMAAAFAAIGEEVESAGYDSIGGVAGGDMAEDRAASGGAAGREFIPDDRFFPEQWGMHNTGQTIREEPGTPDADIDAPEAWAIHTGDFGTVTVALMDSGLNSHPEFGNNAAPFPNGRVLHGYNTVLNSDAPADLTDTCPHGTHVAGIIGATGNNAQGVAGVTWGAYLMPVKVLTGCTGNMTDLTEGIIWAADHGAQVINMPLQYSLTTPATVAALQSAVDYAHDRGAILIAASGIYNSCGVGVVCYPARAAHVIGVSGTDNLDQFFFSVSNYGPEVDVSAPAKNIVSTWISNSYSYSVPGTSSACAHVSGLAALIKSHAPFRTNDQIAEIIQQTADDLGPPGRDNRFGYGRINAANALILARPCASDDECEDNDPCTDNRCDPVEDCLFLDNSGPCDDGMFCTVEDVLCTGGECGGSPRDCSEVGDQCHPAVCNEATDLCEPQPAEDGTSCDDGMFCTVEDVCTSGECGGSPRDCSEVRDQCNPAGVCNEATDLCEPQPAEDGTSCDDGTCRSNDRCISGYCVGELAFGLGEWRQFTECLSGVGVEVQRGCECSDLDGNGIVDLQDVAEFMRQFDGS